jgi:hypothetical protein
MNSYAGVEVWLHVLLTSEIGRDERSVSRVHWIRGWVGPRVAIETYSSYLRSEEIKKDIKEKKETTTREMRKETKKKQEGK